MSRPGSRGKLIRPEAARGHHGELGWLLLARTALAQSPLRRSSPGAGDVEPLGGRLQGPRDRGLVPIELGQARADVGARFRGAVGGGVGALRVAGLLDEILERVAVTLQEGCALRLPVVGEDDQRGRAAAPRRGPSRSGRSAGRPWSAHRGCRAARSRSDGRPRRRPGTSCRPPACRRAGRRRRRRSGGRAGSPSPRRGRGRTCGHGRSAAARRDGAAGSPRSARGSTRRRPR